MRPQTTVITLHWNATLMKYAKICLFYQFYMKYEPDKCICGFHGKYSIIEICQKKFQITLFWFRNYPKRVIYPNLRSTALTYQVLKLHFLRFPTLVSFTSVNQLLWQDTVHVAHKSFPKVGVPIPNEDSSTKIQININFYFINWWLKGMLIQG